MTNLIADYQGTEFLAALREKCARQSEALNGRREAYRKAVEVAER